MRRIGLYALILAPLAWLNLSMFGEAVQQSLPARKPTPAADADTIPRMVVLIFDGVDQRLAAEYMQAGKLPNLRRLAETGSFHKLLSETPPESPTALASLLTGVGPDRHHIFDFVLRGKDNRADNGMTRVIRPRFLAGRIPIRPPQVTSRLAAPTFTERVWRAGYSVLSLRQPMLFPVPRRPGARLSAGLGTPDLSGAAGFYGFHSSRPTFEEGYTTFGGLRTRVHPVPGTRRYESKIAGPQDPTLPRTRSGARRRAEVPVVFEVTEKNGVAGVRIALQGQETFVAKNGRSEFLHVTFELGTLPCPKRLGGIVRFEVRDTQPLEVLVDPVQIDPRDPVLPLFSPPGLGAEMWKDGGAFETMGWQEQTFALNDRFQSDEGFLRDLMQDLNRGRALLLRNMRRIPEGCSKPARLVCYTFTATDRACHCFWRHRDKGHPEHDPDDAFGRSDPIGKVFARMDDIVGDVVAELDPRDTLLVCSDHGFQTWRWEVNINQWLVDKGYLVLKGKVEHKDLGGFFTGASPADAIDWSRTRAFALGLGQIYINLAGRDETGIVPASGKRALMEELREGLLALENHYRTAADRRDGIPAKALRRVTILEDIWDFGKAGPPAHVPDLQLGFDRGYRISWQTALLGGMKPHGDIFVPNRVAWSGDHCSTDPEIVPGIVFSNRAMPPAPPSRPYHVRDIAATVMSHFGIDLAPLRGASEPLPLSR